jgi:superfamily II DNA helicase RecQ
VVVVVVVVVMGTGGGKSLMFMLPAWCGKGGMSVVVVPLIALREDMMRRCRELGIWCEEWNARSQPDAANIVFVAPESAINEEFRTFLNRVRAVGRLDRIIIDECYIILNDKMNFKKHMQKLEELSEVGTQIVMLTATLPPCKEIDEV